MEKDKRRKMQKNGTWNYCRQNKIEKVLIKATQNNNNNNRPCN